MNNVSLQLTTLDRLESEYRPAVEAILSEGMLSLTEAFRRTRLPNPPAGEYTMRLTLAMRALWGGSIQAAAADFNSLLPEAKSDTTGLVDRFISELRPNTVQQILDTSHRQIRDLMAGGLASGESADAVYLGLIERIPGLAKLRAALITRTETHAATQYTSWQLALRSSIPLVKVWNSVNDDRTRDFGELGRISQYNHRLMDGVRVGLRAAFEVPALVGGSESLMFPGDPRGSAGNIINCRCMQTYERA